MSETTTRYRKKPKAPEEVDAIRFDGTGQGHVDVEDWALRLIVESGEEEPDRAVFRGDYRGVHIDTPEGVMTASRDDWIVRDASGQFYPVNPDVFAATYEPVGDGGDQDRRTGDRLAAILRNG